MMKQQPPYKEVMRSGGADSILSNFFRTILMELNVEAKVYWALLDRFVTRTGLAKNAAELGPARTALRRELDDVTMTWKVFLKGLCFINVKHATMELSVTQDASNDVPSVVSFEVDFPVNFETIKTDEAAVLAVLFNMVRDRFGVTDKEKTEEYLNRYIKMSLPKASVAVQHSTKFSLKRELSKETISWKVFVKGLVFLGVSKAEITISLLHMCERVTSHSLTFRFR